LSLLLLVAISIPACLQSKVLLLDGGHTIKNGFESYWNPKFFPIKVYIYSKDPLGYQEGMENAVNVWNSTLGRPVFQAKRMDFTKVLPKGCGWVASVLVPDLDTAGLWKGKYYPETSELCKGQVSISPKVKASNIIKIFVHELGHSLGLAHDKGDKRSIMYPIVFTDYPQYIMPDDSYSVLNMMKGNFTPLPDGKRAKFQELIQSL